MTPPPSRTHPVRWRLVLATFVAIVGVVGYLLVTVFEQNRTLDDRVAAQIARSDAIERAADSVRLPVCAILYAALSRPVEGLTPEQIQARLLYVAAYGEGTPDEPGLHCARELPESGG